MFSRFFRRKGTRKEENQPVRVCSDTRESKRKLQLYLGHSVEDSPLLSGGDTRDLGDLKYFQESFADQSLSPCESYVSIQKEDEEEEVFVPGDVSVSPEVIDAFVRLPLSMSLLSVPGIGFKNDAILRRGGIANTHQMIGQFLLFQGSATSTREMANKFYRWLGTIGVVNDRSTITASLAEKIGTWVPGVYDPDVYKT